MAAGRSELLTFLIADIRGYTRFTQEHGDEAAARLTGKLVATVRDLVTGYEGRLHEVRGDEALCVFASSRQSLRFAVALQRRLVAETAADPSLPMAVGIGVDTGAAVRNDDGYRGGALNLAARLCERARAGEILASPQAVRLARPVDGVRYETGDPVVFKGLTVPVRPIRVVPDGADPVEQMSSLVPAPPRAFASATRSAAGRRPGRRRRPLAAALVAVVAAAVTLAVQRGSGEHSEKAVTMAENSVGILDPSTGTVIGDVAVDPGPVAAAAGLGAIWTADTQTNTVSRIDAQTHAITRIPVGSAPSAIAVGFGSVWVANGQSGTVSRIDPTSDRVLAITVGTDPGGLVAADGAMWVTDTGQGSVSQIDPATDSVEHTVQVGYSPTGIAAGGNVWVANSGSDTVSEIDVRTASVTQTVPVGNEPQNVVAAGSDIWVSDNLDGSVARVADDATSVSATVAVGGEPTQLAYVDGRLWVATQANRSLAEVTVGPSPHLVRAVPLGVIPTGTVAYGNRLWITGTTDPARHVGGILHLRGGDPGEVDPSYDDDPTEAMLLASSYDGLIGIRHTSGAEGTELVPDLAVAIPEPTDGGLTYTFQLRSGIRWSDGTPVTGADVRRGLERAIASGIVAVSGEIVGAAGCSPEQCDVSGIDVNPSGDVVITLTRPNSNFLQQISTFAVAVPADTPLGDQGIHPLPATGPYEISRYVAHQLIVLTRNPYFREWSPAAQPSGYPDEIDWQIDPGDIVTTAQADAEVEDVATGRTDWADARFSGPVSALAARFGSRLYVSPQESTSGVTLNTRIAPFNDVRVRRAVAFAVDRAAAAASWPDPATVTCQILPPDFPGYQPYCPYTLRQSATGAWNAPDLATALTLVKASGTQGMSVTVWSPPHPAPAIQTVVTALRELGYRVDFKVGSPGGNYFDYVSDSRNKVQASFSGWIAGDVSPADYVLPLFTCAAFQPADPHNQNVSQFCDPAVDTLIDHAQQLESTSPEAADTAWAAVDRAITDAAPWVSLVTPSSVDVVSARVHNYVDNPVFGALFDQMWVR